MNHRKHTNDLGMQRPSVWGFYPQHTPCSLKWFPFKKNPCCKILASSQLKSPTDGQASPSGESNYMILPEAAGILISYLPISRPGQWGALRRFCLAAGGDHFLFELIHNDFTFQILWENKNGDRDQREVTLSFLNVQLYWEQWAQKQPLVFHMGSNVRWH